MKLFHAFITILLCIAALTAQSRTLDEIKKDGKIIIATEGAYPPFNYFQGSKLTGFEVELGDAVAKKMGLAVEWKSLTFDALLAGLRQDRWDVVMASFGITEERSKAVGFTSPHYCSGGVIVSKDPAIRTAESLRDKVVAVQTGSTYFESVKKLPGVKEVKNFPQDIDARSALINGRVDAWVSDLFAVKIALETNPGAGLKMGRFLFVERIAAAIKKGNPTLTAAYDKALAELMTDGTYKNLSEKYFKGDIRCL
ncbi:ABC transporter substrate-binding protein [Undibacterium arcticum]|uniref:ABC transporter substrate-binding protein n=1 Tax=Undibacterium arcticum TaxID=1762892 RepID=A0ABV7F215_9BURK